MEMHRLWSEQFSRNYVFTSEQCNDRERGHHMTECNARANDARLELSFQLHDNGSSPRPPPVPLLPAPTVSSVTFPSTSTITSIRA
jgi:hypothetical protein